MATQWNTETMEEARAGNYFIPVSDLGKDKVTINEAEKIWESNPDILFQAGARVVGLKDDLLTVFQEFLDDEQVETMMAEAISSANYKEKMSAQFENEMQTWKDEVIEANVKSEGRTMTDVIAVANNKTPINKEAVKVLNEGKRSPGKKTPSTPGKRGRGVTPLQQRVTQAIEKGQYLVVSKLTETGSGTTFASAPTSGRARNYYNDNPDLPISSNDLDHFIMAIEMLEDGTDRYAEDIENAEAFFNTPKEPAKKTTPKTTPKTATKSAATTEAESTVNKGAPSPATGRPRLVPSVNPKK